MTFARRRTAVLPAAVSSGHTLTIGIFYTVLNIMFIVHLKKDLVLVSLFYLYTNISKRNSNNN